MKRQKSFEEDGPKLYLVPTPIGNLNEMTPRALEVLSKADVIACEDTRTSGQLLHHFGIPSRLIAYQNFNEDTSAKGIIKLLQEGNTVALISDAGYPLINDPGQRLVNEAVNAGFPVIPVSGCSAFLDALVASGLKAQPFLFVGFLPPSHNDRIKALQMYQNYPMTLIFYEAPHRIERMLTDVLAVLGNRQAVLARELTKVHEEFLRGTIEELLEVCPTLKGEMVLMVEGAKQEEVQVSDEDVRKYANALVEQGISRSDAVKQTAKKFNLAKNRVYELVHGDPQ
ncbi:MAG: 16S rRNA (cytidine(1402)-2'-O)-methyltransferase [Lactimicrobium sp.]|uniref:16S rRNA (cytidine(1402)-2'-O)-methyltransferase n=1 Tax=Lactimicrobium sp. TaxID=2563780 RepID=UPI002F358438